MRDVWKKWTSFDTFRLISEFEANTFLWNVFEDEYKNKRLKSKAIEKLAKNFETSPREINRKLHNLRCQYTSELRKLRSRSGSSDRHQSQWVYFDSLKFLAPVVNVRSHPDNDVMATLAIYEPARSECSSAAYNGDTYSEEDQEEGSSAREIKFNPLELELMRKKADPGSDFPELEDDKAKVAADIIKLDDFDIFGKLVATHLRKMPLDRAIRCQEKLFTLLMQERLAESDAVPQGKAADPPYSEAPSP